MEINKNKNKIYFFIYRCSVCVSLVENGTLSQVVLLPTSMSWDFDNIKLRFF